MAGDQTSSQWHLDTGPYLGEISALCFLHFPSHFSSLPYLLVGSGSHILVYDLESGKMARSFTVFQGVRVHGMTSRFSESVDVTDSSTLSFTLAVYGEKKVKLFSFFIQVCYGYSNESKAFPHMKLVQLLPNFPSWVLDVCFMKEGSVGSRNEERQFLAVGCSDNSVHIWDIANANVVIKVISPVRCLLYSMRFWGEDLEALRIASGTIFNEVLVWRMGSLGGNTSLLGYEEHIERGTLLSSYTELIEKQYKAVHICKLVGHQGSIFRMVWSVNGSKLVSVSDDRSARIWDIPAEEDMESSDCKPVSLILFGHNARVWDCNIFDSLIFTVSEDCTCRVWGIDGTPLQMIKEHLGRGIWRCLYDPISSLLVTAGFDSAIKVHRLRAYLSRGFAEDDNAEFIGETDTFSIRIPNTSEDAGQMNSKSEYVRCLHLKSESSLYVATNQGYLYHGRLSNTGDVRWTELVRVCDEAPIVSMDLLPEISFEIEHGFADWVALGDGKGMLTVVAVTVTESTLEVRSRCTWPAERERQLLGSFWCKSLGYRYIFNADPRGKLKLWRISGPLQSNTCSSTISSNISCIAKFSSDYGIRIICLDASAEEEVLVCGDLRGNLVLFPLPQDLLLGKTSALEVNISPSSHFKGAHGISSVSSVTVARISSSQIEIQSTGADSCMCYLEYGRDSQSLEFVGMKQLKELSLIESISLDNRSADKLSSGYAAGFAAVDFIVWNLTSETKVVQIPCGGWRRPHSYYLGDVPEIRHCFAYVKDDIIHIHKHWENDGNLKIYPQSLHIQFHGREIHSLCFIYTDLLEERFNNDFLPKSSLVATGCEDGTLRLTWYSPLSGQWSISKLLGQHVAGSAVRSICCASKLHIIWDGGANIYGEKKGKYVFPEEGENATVLVSVGAKRVLTSWLLRNRKIGQNKNANLDQQYGEVGNDDLSSSSVSFQWLSTDTPCRYTSTFKNPATEKKVTDVAVNNYGDKTDAWCATVFPEKGIGSSRDICEDDWRYLAITAFLVKHASSKITVCFMVVACSDATLAFRALVLPLRLWFDIALLVPSPSPVLALQHIIIPICRSSEGNHQCTDIYMAISGSTDGSITFWDLTESVETFMQQVSILNVENSFDCQKRPRTGRGSQGGRRWRSLSSSVSKKSLDQCFNNLKCGDKLDSTIPSEIPLGTSSVEIYTEKSNMASSQAKGIACPESETVSMESQSEIIEIQPLHMFDKIHQSGVNCLHVSELRNGDSSESRYAYNVVSGGDDQALNHLLVELFLVQKSQNLHNKEADITYPNCNPENVQDFNLRSRKLIQNHPINFLHHSMIPSAHSSSVKGVWTDGSWVFSTGLDQRIRCWRIVESTLHEHAFLIVSVPEPEALCARICARDSYQICVTGRGMQMVEFSASPDASN